MVTFYSSSDYAPYAVDGWDVDLTTTVGQPARGQNRVLIEVSECLVQRSTCQDSTKATIYFNFTGAHQIADAWIEQVITISIHIY